MIRGQKTVIALFALVLFTTAARAAEEPGWTFQAVDRTANGNRGISTLLGRDGRLHIAYTGCSDAKCNQDELFYGVRELNGRWVTGAVDSDKGKTGWSVSMVLDRGNDLHLFYSNHYKLPMLRHAVRPFSSKSGPSKDWKKEVVGKVAGGYWASAAEGVDGIYVANTVFPTNDVSKSAFGVDTLARDGSWTHEVLDTSFDAGWFTTTAIGADGLPLVLYVSNGYPDGDLNLARKQADGKWTSEVLDNHVVKSSMAVDAKGFVHIAYNMIDEKFMKGRDLMYATNAPDGRWHKTLVEGGEYAQQDTGHFPALKIDAEGGLHILYEDNFHEKIMYARNLGDGWKLYPVTRNKQDGYYAAFEIDPQGGLHLLYDNGYQLNYAFCPDCAVH